MQRSQGLGWTLLLAAVLAAPARAQTEEPSLEGSIVDGDLTAIEELDLAELLGVEVVVASRIKESLREAPVPVTVITANMIRSIGARSLRDVLEIFVPGMSQVEDHNEMNVAMRGVYASSQQKILVLLNGHRMNSRAYSMANPDFSLSLDKVAQIEVIRGPGSSVYGNVALTGVVNIVTKEGKDLDGVSVSGGFGNFGQLRGNAMLGKQLGPGHDLLLWANGYRADGERVEIASKQDYSAVPRGGVAVVDGVKDPASYDVGLHYRLEGLWITANVRQGKVIEPFTSAGVTGEVYDYDSYRTLSGHGPGISSQSNHLTAGYTKNILELFDLTSTIYLDTNHLVGPLVTSPTSGGAIAIDWREYDIGAQLQGSVPYDFGAFGNGNLMLGGQVDHMELYDSAMYAATDGEWKQIADSSDKPLLQQGTETIYSSYGQLRHRLFDQVIVNLGARLDFKQRHKGDPVWALSPRLGVVYSPLDMFSVKLSYAESFVDAPYWYRYNSLGSYGGSENLQPERLRALQLTPMLTFLDGKLQSTTNLFVQNLSDFIFRDNSAGGTLDDPFYKNAGSLLSTGVEEELAYVERDYRVRLIATWQYAISAEDYPMRDGRVFNVPSLSGALVVDVNPLWFWDDMLWLNATGQYIGPQLSPVDITFKNADGVVVNRYEEPEHEVEQAFLVNLGMHITDPFIDGLFVDVNVHNVFDTRRFQGGSTLHPYPRQGRWFMVNVGYNWQL